VAPGDLLHGDENGLITIPAGVEEVLPAATMVIDRNKRCCCPCPTFW